MLDLNILAIVLWLLLFIFCAVVAKEVFTPPVMFSGLLGIFYLDLFVSSHEPEMFAVYIAMLIAVALGSYPYVRRKKRTHYRSGIARDLESNRPIPMARIWIMAIPAVTAQLYMIFDFGGLAGYALAAKFGTREFAGMGPLKTIIASIYPLGIICFCYYISASDKVKEENLPSLILFKVIIFVMALLTLSRGTLLSYFLLMFICAGVLGSKISTFKIVSFIAVALIVASIYGVARETFSIQDESFDLGIESREQGFKTEWMEFGTFPLMKVLENNSIEPSFGLTYLTVVTNFVPRVIWPEKPDPGGVVFTRDYAPGLYDEYNQYTTGLMPEAMINFGIIGGAAFGFIQLTFLVYISSFVSRNVERYRASISSRHKMSCLAAAYAYFLWYTPFFLTGEFTNVMIGLIIKVILISLYYVLLARRSFW